MTQRTRRPLLLCLVCTFFSTSSLMFASEVRETRKLREDKAVEFTNQLRDRDYDAAMALLSKALQDKIGAQGLKSIIEKVESHCGKLIRGRSFEFEKLADVWGYQGFTKWEKASHLCIWVSFDERNLIDGLWFDGSHAGTPIGFPKHGISVGRLEPYASKAIHKLSASVVLPDGQPVRKSSVTFWKSVNFNDVPEDERKSLWVDPESGRTWLCVEGAATGNQMSAFNLTPGSYRVTAREGHNGTGSIGISPVTQIETEDLAIDVDVVLQRGEILTINPIDVDTHTSAPRPSLTLRPIGGRSPSWTIRPLRSDELPIRFESLMPGKYRVIARRRSSSADGLQYEMADKEQVIEVAVDEANNVDLRLKARLLSDEEVNAQWGWTAFGRVIDDSNNPLPNAEVRVATGWGTLFGGGSAKTNSHGEFRLRFAEGVNMVDPTGVNVQAAHFSASLPGYTVKEATKSNETVMARKLPAKDSRYGHQSGEIPLREKPFRIDFIMTKNAEQEVQLKRGDDELAGAAKD